MLFADGAIGILTNLRGHLDKFIVDNGPGMLGNLVSASIILFVGQWIVKLLANLLALGLKRAGLDQILAKFLVRIAKPLMMIMVIIAALEQLGVKTAQFTAVLAAIGLAIGLSLQGSLSNFASGILLILFRPFKVGDFVEAGTSKGIVEEVHIFHTIMRTPDNVRVVVPNSSITGDTISNYSAESTRRIDLVVGCGYKDHLPAVKKFLTELVTSHPSVLKEPEPVVAVNELADSCVNFVVRPWVASKAYWKTRWELTEAIKLGFDKRGFQIPFPQQELHLHQANVAAVTSPETFEAVDAEGSLAADDAEPSTKSAAELIAPRRAA